MRNRLFSLVAKAIFLSLPLAATALDIDDFSSNQLSSIAIGPPNPRSDVTSAAASLGNRTIALERTAGFGSACADVNGTRANVFSLSKGPGVVANVTLRYADFGIVDVTDAGTHPPALRDPADPTQVESITLPISGPASLDLQRGGLRTAPIPAPGGMALFGSEWVSPWSRRAGAFSGRLCAARAPRVQRRLRAPAPRRPVPAPR